LAQATQTLVGRLVWSSVPFAFQTYRKMVAWRAVAAIVLAKSVAANTNGTSPNDLCSDCKDKVNQLANSGTKGACAAACKLIPGGVRALCSEVCGLIPTLCGPKAKEPCGQAVCDAISICAHNPWEQESVWNFSAATDKPSLTGGNGDIIELTSRAPSDDVPAGTVKVGIKCTASSGWWKSVTMFKGAKFLREVAAQSGDKGKIHWGSIKYADLKDHYFSLSKAEFLGVHVNVYHITNAVEMKERGTYIFDWQKDKATAAVLVV